LNLDGFNLSAAAQMGSWAGTIEAPAGMENLILGGETFWSSLKAGPASALDEEDCTLLANVFHPHLSDRREEGASFVPPPTSLTYMHRLKTLVAEEATVMERRKEHFFSEDFLMESAGPLFPSSWNSTIELAAQTGGSSLILLPDFDTEINGFQEAINAGVPVFDKHTEDGTRFLVYHLGKLEIRAVEDLNGKRVVGAVFLRESYVQEDSEDAKHLGLVSDASKLAKVTAYVEAAPTGALRCRFYVVFVTEEGHTIVTEQLADGTITWAEDPEGLETRNSLAKVMRAVECSGTVGNLRRKFANRKPISAKSPSERKRYAQAVFCDASAVL